MCIRDRTYTVNADKTVTLEYVDGNDNTVNKTAKIDLSNLPTGDKAAVESVVKKSAAAGDTNIADITVADGKQTGDANAKYEVNVSRNAVKDAAREAVTVNNGGTTTGGNYTADADNPITVNPVKDDAKHNTTYEVKFDGEKAAKQIPLTYKANGTGDQTVKLDKGLNFTNGSNTTASVAADGVVKYDLNKDVDLTKNGSLTIGDTKVNNDGVTITGGPSVKKDGINAGNQKITNVKPATDGTDAVNYDQLKAARTVVTSNDKSVTINKTTNGDQVTYDLHVNAAAGTASTWNLKSGAVSATEGTHSGDTDQNIADGKSVTMQAGKNLTVKQTNDGNGNTEVAYALDKDLKDLDSVTTKEVKLGDKNDNISIKKDGDRITYSTDGGTTVKKVANLDDEKHIKPGSYAVQNDGSVTMTYVDGNGKPVTGEEAKITGIAKNDLSNITDDGKKVITGLGSKVKAGDNVTVTDTTDATTGQKTYTVNAKLAKIEDGKNTKKSGTGTDADPYKINVEGDLTDINSITNGAGSGKLTFGPNETVTVGGTNPITLNAKTGNIGGLTNKTFDPTNIVSGQAATEDQLKSVHDTLKASELHIAPTAVKAGSTEAKGGVVSGTENVYKYDAGTKKVTLTYNDGNGKAVTDTKAVIDFSDLNIPAAGNNYGFKANAIAGDGKLDGAATATAVENGGTVNFAAGKNLTVKQTSNEDGAKVEYALSDDIKVGNDGKDGKDGVDGKIGVNGKDGSAVVINGKDGSIGLNGKDGKDGLTIRGANGQDGVNGTNGTNGITRIVYEDKNNNKHEVATTDDGLKFTGNNESVVNKNKLNSTVKVKGEGVTEEQEKTFESAAGNIAVTADGNDTLNIRLNKNIKGIDSIQTKEIHLGTPDNYTTIKKDGDRIKYGDKTFANTDDIWTIQANGTDVPANGGKVNVKGADGITVSKSANGEMTISGSGLGTMNSFNVKSSGNTTADSETAAKKITDGKTVEFSGGKNLTVKQTSDANGAKVEYALSNNVDLTNKGSVTIGDTKITDGGLVINNGPSVTKDGINAGNKQITNVEDGVNDTDAVNVRQLKAAKTNLVDGQNTKVTGDGSKTNPYKVNVEGDLNKITSITNNEGDGKLEFKGDQVVNVAGDNTIKLDGKTGDITGLTNKTLDSADFATKGRAATEEQLKLVQQEAAKKSTEKVQAKADANNIAKVAPKAGDTFGAAGATYEVSVDKNDVKDAAREAVTVSGDKKAITVDVQPNATNHTTNYQVNFNGKEAAKQIPLTYKENGGNARTVMLSDGLDFSNGVNTTAHTDANGKVSFDVKGDLTNITSISNNSNGPKVSFGGDTVNITGGNLNMGGNKITNVQRGTNDTDAVNVKQLKDSRTTLTSDDQSVVLKKTESADGGLNYDLSVKGAVDPRVDQLNEEIGRVGAQGAALSALKPMQYDPLEPTQIMAGYGNYRGNSAIAVGVAHYKNESTMFHGGLSWAGGSSHMMANAGVTWKVGNRDAEAAVADRYRKGPISSAYAVQTEMAAMKAQNAGLKGEVLSLIHISEPTRP